MSKFIQHHVAVNDAITRSSVFRLLFLDILNLTLSHLVLYLFYLLTYVYFYFYRVLNYHSYENNLDRLFKKDEKKEDETKK